MDYVDLYNNLKQQINYHEDVIFFDDKCTIYNLDFKSHNFKMLPGESEYVCRQHQTVTHDPYNFENETGIVNEILDIHDSQVEENQNFRYHMFMPAGALKTKGVIILFHGFNEKYWHKYLPWAHRMMEQTGKAIILFPLAFHMNRAPVEWSERRLMYKVSELRKKTFPNIIDSSLSNVAISTRIQAKPQRFFWSGIQTYSDVIQLMHQIRSGNHPLIYKDASVDFFAYSIGNLLGEILLMNNPENIFEKSKLCIFCGGPVFSRMSPVSKFILDSEANVSLYSFVIEHLESHLKKDDRLRHYLSDNHPEGIAFQCMLNYKSMIAYREEKFRHIGKRIMAIALEKDTVMAPYEVVNTLQGTHRDIPIPVNVFDFPYDYKHEDPFPISEKLRNDVDKCFNKVFDEVSLFLKI